MCQLILHGHFDNTNDITVQLHRENISPYPKPLTWEWLLGNALKPFINMILMMQKHTCLLSVCSVLTSLTRDTPSHYSKLLLALCAGRRSVALVDFVPDAGAEIGRAHV